MSVNKFIGLGNVTKDPDVRVVGEHKVATFGLAMNERGYTLKNGTQVPERVEFINIVVWRGLAEIVEKYVRKGTKLYIEGKIKTRNYDDKDGVKRYITEIYADQLELLGGKPLQQEESTYSRLENQVNDRAKDFAQANAPKDDDLPF